MSGIEEMVRDTFRQRADTAPALEAVADRAIAGARRTRRNRTAFASVSAALSVALVGFGLVSFAGDRGPGIGEPGPSGASTSVATPVVSTPPVDLVLGDRLLLADGGERSLTDELCPSCSVTGAWRVPQGWLVTVYHSTNGTGIDTSALWLLPEVGEPTEIVAGHGNIAVSPGTAQRPGIQIAWAAGEEGLLKVGRYAGGPVTGIESTELPYANVPLDDLGDQRPLYPRAVVGAAVVLAGTYTGGGLDLWDAWFPGRGDYVPAENPAINLYAVTADGERLIAGYPRYPGTGSRESCLGELDPDGFVPLRSLCPSPLGEFDRVVPSPDGRWWLVISTESVALYDADTVWSSAPVRRWPPPAETFGGAWLDDTSFVVMGRSTVLTGYADGRPEETASISLPADLAAAVTVVDLR
jgi:hypothetical protein